MSYQVLARKYRPQSFEEVVGQEHVTTTLKNAIKNNRLHHAYLFTGVRGTGKTSLARILAKSLNCEDGPKVNPDPNSPNCQAIAKGQFLDVIEIDGASNTSVESVRELREQVKYMPAAGKYKIYIIDEVHMLSTSAFNALLKTLEEPPPHVVFIFATTEVHKIPVTILSRCQRFDLRRLSQGQIQERLEFICKKEGISSDQGILDLLSRAAEGSMRDGQSLLDMAIGLCGEKLQAEPLREMLGLIETTWIEDLSRACLHGKLQEALDKVKDIYHRGYDLRQIVVQWVEYLHDLTLLKAVGGEAIREQLSPDQIKFMEETVSSVELSDLQVAFQTVYKAADQIYRSDSPKILFDILLVKLVHGTPYQSLGDLLSSPEPSGSGLRSAPPGTTRSRPQSGSESLPRLSDSGRSPVRGPAQHRPEQAPSRDTGDILQKALKKLPQVKAILNHALSQGWEENNFVVIFEKGSLWEDMLKEKKEILSEALGKVLGQTVKVQLREGEKSEGVKTSGPPPKVNKSDDPVVQQAVEILNATIQEVRKT